MLSLCYYVVCVHTFFSICVLLLFIILLIIYLTYCFFFLSSILFLFVFVFFFFKQKTAYEMRISDWSSDVCSSDLPAAEISAGDLPDQVAAMAAMIGADASFARVLGEAAQLRALVQGHDRVGAERPEAHGRDVEDRSGIGLRTLVVADQRPEGRRVGDRRRTHRVTDELVTVGIGVDERAEGALVRLPLGARIDQRPLRPGKQIGRA